MSYKKPTKIKPLREIIAEHGFNEKIKNIRIDYLNNYLSAINVTSYVIEKDHSDPDFFNDHRAYYSKAHNWISSLVTRVHFFSGNFDDIETSWQKSQTLDDKEKEGLLFLNNNYLGYIVLRPLPNTIIGTTCLTNYSNKKDTGVRVFPISRNYSVCLFGRKLSVKTVAFQEQDNEVAACSTTAIWFLFHGLPEIFNTNQIESPFSISKKAIFNTNKPTSGEVARKFPSEGLSLEQIQHYLISRDLDFFVLGMSEDKKIENLSNYVKVFSAAKKPIILVGRLYRSIEKDKNYLGGELHAITVLGFSLDADGRTIKSLYAHDDNTGPFARFEAIVENCSFSLDCSSTGENIAGYLAALKDGNGCSHLLNEVGKEFRRFVPFYGIFPCPAEARLPYENILRLSEALHQIFDSKFPRMFGDSKIPGYWHENLLISRDDFLSELLSADWVDRIEANSFVDFEGLSSHFWLINFYELNEANKIIRPLTLVINAASLRQCSEVCAVLQGSEECKYRDSYVSALTVFLKEFKDLDEIHSKKYPPDVQAGLMSLAELLLNPS